MSNISIKLDDEKVRKEYENAFLLKLFGAVCNRMKDDLSYHNKIMKLYSESFNYEITTKIIIEKETNIKIEDEDAKILSKWMKARLKKKPNRLTIPQGIKEELWNKQIGKCAICGCNLGKEWSKIHVDHIIPWDLVGDELDNNFQDLCEHCNEQKSANTNYIFLKMINLV